MVKNFGFLAGCAGNSSMTQNYIIFHDSAIISTLFFFFGKVMPVKTSQLYEEESPMKKILVMALSVALIATMAITGTVAYLSDQDAAVNQATVGTVFVKQYEKLRKMNNDDTLTDFVDGEMIVPAVVPAASSAPEKTPVSTPGDKTVSMRNDINNYHDKIVYAQNTGTSPAYMRTVIGVPAGSYQTWLHLDFNTDANWTIPVEDAAPAASDVAISGGLYDLYVLNYSEKVEKDGYTTANLLGFYVDNTVNNVKGEDGQLSHYVYGNKNIGNISDLKIFVATQAVQAEGFADAAAAFAGTYGDVTKTSHPWLGKITEQEIKEMAPLDTETDESGVSYALIYTAEDLFRFAHEYNSINNDSSVQKNSYTGVKLMADIDLKNQPWTPIGQTSRSCPFNGIFDGNGKTISNLYIDSTGETEENFASGLIGWSDDPDAVIKNLTISGAVVKGADYTGVIAGYFSGTIEDCTVKNATVIGSCNHDNDRCGNNIGGLVGFVNKDPAKANCGIIKNCEVENSNISGARNVGKMIGTLQNGATFTGNTANRVAVSANAANCTDEDKGTNIGDVIGRNLNS